MLGYNQEGKLGVCTHADVYRSIYIQTYARAGNLSFCVGIVCPSYHDVGPNFCPSGTWARMAVS